MHLSAESLTTIDAIIESHKTMPGPVKLMLHDIQKSLGYIPFEAIEKIDTDRKSVV